MAKVEEKIEGKVEEKIEEKVEEKVNVKVEVQKYSKEQILLSKAYANRKDILNVILEDKEYTTEAVDKMLENFLKKEVK